MSAKLPEGGKWPHVAMIYDDDAGKVYLNGELDAEGQGAGALNKSNVPLMVTADCERAHYAFDGIIDEFRMFHQALSQERIGFYMKKSQLAIEPVGNLTTTWASIKAER